MRGEKNTGERAAYPKYTHTSKNRIQLKNGQKLDTSPQRRQTAVEKHMRT